MHEEELFLLSLSQVAKVGPINARNLISYCGSAKAVFEQPLSQLEKIPGIGTIQAHNIKRFKDFNWAERELAFCQKEGIQVMSILDKAYPKRLKRIYDAPLVLFYQGSTALDAEKTICIIGTRKCTEYGKEAVKHISKQLEHSGILVFSGLAYGIDVQAHRAALEYGLPTVGVLGHGLDRLYPAIHRSVVNKMLENGGLLTEFPTGTKPDRENFPSRNRIVAGLSDACIVVESAIKGGAMITAEIANSYHKDVFAIPGPIDSEVSKGTHKLIKSNEAFLMESAADLLFQMGWNKGQERHQTMLPLELSALESAVLQALASRKKTHIDDLHAAVEMSTSQLSLNLLELEMKGLVRSWPGKMYERLR